MEKYILDTNLFFNMEGNMGMGNKTEEVIRNMTKVMNEKKVKPNFICHLALLMNC